MPQKINAPLKHSRPAELTDPSGYKAVKGSTKTNLDARLRNMASVQQVTINKLNILLRDVKDIEQRYEPSQGAAFYVSVAIREATRQKGLTDRGSLGQRQNTNAIIAALNRSHQFIAKALLGKDSPPEVRADADEALALNDALRQRAWTVFLESQKLQDATDREFHAERDYTTGRDTPGVLSVGRKGYMYAGDKGTILAVKDEADALLREMRRVENYYQDEVVEQNRADGKSAWSAMLYNAKGASSFASTLASGSVLYPNVAKEMAGHAANVAHFAPTVLAVMKASENRRLQSGIGAIQGQVNALRTAAGKVLALVRKEEYSRGKETPGVLSVGQKADKPSNDAMLINNKLALSVKELQPLLSRLNSQPRRDALQYARDAYWSAQRAYDNIYHRPGGRASFAAIYQKLGRVVNDNMRHLDAQLQNPANAEDAELINALRQVVANFRAVIPAISRLVIANTQNYPGVLSAGDPTKDYSLAPKERAILQFVARAGGKAFWNDLPGAIKPQNNDPHPDAPMKPRRNAVAESLLSRGYLRISTGFAGPRGYYVYLNNKGKNALEMAQ